MPRAVGQALHAGFGCGLVVGRVTQREHASVVDGAAPRRRGARPQHAGPERRDPSSDPRLIGQWLPGDGAGRRDDPRTGGRSTAARAASRSGGAPPAPGSARPSAAAGLDQVEQVAPGLGPLVALRQRHRQRPAGRSTSSSGIMRELDVGVGRSRRPARSTPCPVSADRPARCPPARPRAAVSDGVGSPAGPMVQRPRGREAERAGRAWPRPRAGHGAVSSSVASSRRAARSPIT